MEPDCCARGRSVRARSSSRHSPRPLAIVLLWAASADACPEGWSASPAGKCYKVMSERVTHYGCVEQCGPGSGFHLERVDYASLACIRSAEEKDFAVGLVGKGDVVWVGNYQAPFTSWGQCSTGEVSGYVKLAIDPQPSSENCATMSTWAAQGAFGGDTCAHTRRCLCEQGPKPGANTSYVEGRDSPHASSAYLDFVRADIKAFRRSNEAALLFGLWIPLSWALPALLLLCGRCCRRCVRSLRALPQTTLAPASTGADNAVGTLAASEKAAAALRLRVAGTAAQIGWMLSVVAVQGCFRWTSKRDLTPVIGTFTYYLIALPWGLALLLLAIRPIDAAAIQTMGVMGFLFFLFMALSVGIVLDPLIHTDGHWITRAVLIAISIVCFICAALLFPALVCDGCCWCSRCPASFRLPPRRLLQRGWLAFRFLCVVFSAAFSAIFFGPLATGFRIAPTWRANDEQTAVLAASASFLLAALVLTPSTRGRVTRWLGSLGKGGAKDQEAASVAALLGKRNAAETYATAIKTFRSMPLRSLTLEELAHSTPDPALFQKTEPAAIGAVHAFVSHSWSDAGGAKFDRLHEWAAALEGEEQTGIWLDKVPSLTPPREPMPSLRRGCALKAVVLTNVIASLPPFHLPLCVRPCWRRRASTSSTSRPPSRASRSSSRAASSSSSWRGRRTRPVSGASWRSSSSFAWAARARRWW